MLRLQLPVPQFTVHLRYVLKTPVHRPLGLQLLATFRTDLHPLSPPGRNLQLTASLLERLDRCVPLNGRHIMFTTGLCDVLLLGHLLLPTLHPPDACPGDLLRLLDPTGGNLHLPVTLGHLLPTCLQLTAQLLDTLDCRIRLPHLGGELTDLRGHEERELCGLLQHPGGNCVQATLSFRPR